RHTRLVSDWSSDVCSSDLVIPVVHKSDEGQDGRVHIEFYGKEEANPLVRLSWTDAQGRPHKQERNLPALTGEMMPRLTQARVRRSEERRVGKEGGRRGAAE